MRSGQIRPGLALICAALLSACGSNEQEAATAPPPEVGYITVTSESLTLHRELPGRTNAFRIAEVRPQVTGVIRERLFEEGAEVKAGEALYRLDDSLYRSAVASAEAEVARARAANEMQRLTIARFDRLVSVRAVSQQEYDMARAAFDESSAAVAAAEAALQAARINLDYATIKAPIAGRAGRSSVTAGALVTANQAETLTTIRQLDPIYIDLTQSNAELRQLRAAMQAGQLQRVSEDEARVTLLLEDGSAYEHAGTLQFAEYAVDESTGSVTLRALFPNPEGDLLPGMFVRARLPEGRRDNTVLVPQKGIARDPRGNATALVVNADDTVEQRAVVTERAIGNQWLVSRGLEAGDRLIVDGLQRIRPGVTVTPVQLDDQATAAEAADAAVDSDR